MPTRSIGIFRQSLPVTLMDPAHDTRHRRYYPLGFDAAGIGCRAVYSCIPIVYNGFDRHWHPAKRVSAATIKSRPLRRWPTRGSRLRANRLLGRRSCIDWRNNALRARFSAVVWNAFIGVETAPTILMVSPPYLSISRLRYANSSLEK